MCNPSITLRLPDAFHPPFLSRPAPWRTTTNTVFSVTSISPVLETVCMMFFTLKVYLMYWYLIVAFRTMLPSVLNAFQRIANPSDPLKIHYSAISYKPFDSLFNMTGVVNSGNITGGLGMHKAVVMMAIC